jgi:ABC-type glycerol-3-phosphate transport system substrate-binding protein
VRVTRRQFLATAGAAAAPLALGACGFTKSSSPADSGSDTLTFTTWGTDSELAGFRAAIARFEKAESPATVSLNAVPYEQMFSNIDAQIQAGNPPDVFRVPYYTFGSYAGAGQLLDLTSYLEQGFSGRFTEQAWAAVQNSGKPYGVPHHTDTSVILYNKTLLDAAGVTSVPTTAEGAWTWDQLLGVAGKLRSSLPGSKYPMAYNWQGNGVTRWLSLLFQADGRFLAEDLKAPAIDSAAGRAAVDFSKRFFTDKLVPANDSVKSTTYAADTWYSQTSAMVWGGAFMLPDADTTATFEWGATYAPRKVRGGGDFGGNALVATAKAKDPTLAAKFLAFATEAEQQKAFCVGASLLPTRADLVQDGITFDVRGELTKVFLGQARQVKASDSGQVASPSMSKIITVLKDQLEQAFVGGQSTEDTIAGLTKGIAGATGA